MAGIVYSDYYLPEEKVDSREVLRPHMPDDEAEKFRDFSKIHHVYVEKKREDVEIFISLVDKFFKRTGIPQEDIDYIIHAYPLRYRQGRIAIHYLIQKYFGLNNATVLLMDCQCAANLQAMRFADALIGGNKAKNVMIITNQAGFDFLDRYAKTTIVGDAAGILVMGKENPRASFLDFMSYSDGTFSWNEYNNIPIDFDNFKFIRAGANFITNVIKKNNLTIGDIKLIIPQNINYSLYYNVYAKFIGISPEKLYLNSILDGGHTADVDIIRNYTDVARSSRLQAGDKFILYGMGIEEMDITYNVGLLRYNG